MTGEEIVEKTELSKSKAADPAARSRTNCRASLRLLPPIALGPSEGNGFDVEAKVRVWKDRGRSVSLFGNFSTLTRELVNRPGGKAIPDVADFFGTYGFDLVMPLPEAT